MSSGRYDPSRLPAARDYFASQGIETKKANREGWAMALCPLHDDRRPSLSLNLRTGGFRCLACGASGGGVLDFHMLRYGLAFKQAARDLGAWLDEYETAEQRAARERANRAKRTAAQERDAKRQAREREAAEQASWRAAAAWYGADPAPADHPYLMKKRLPACGARHLARFAYSEHALADALLVGMRDILGRIGNVQGIDAAGNKRFVAGAPTRALFAPVIVRGDGRFVDAGAAPAVVGIAEGWASACAFALIHKTPTVAALSAGNVPHVACALRGKWPHCRLQIAVDNDRAGAQALGETWGTLAPAGRLPSMESLGIEEATPAPIFKDWADQYLETRHAAA